MTGCLLLTFGVLTLLAPPVESHDPLVHPLPGAGLTLDGNSAHGHTHSLGFSECFGGLYTVIHPKHFEIEWIRIYKNPKTTPLEDPNLKVIDDYKKDNTVTNRIITAPGFPNRRARLFPSSWKDYEAILDGDTTLAAEAHTYFWVDIDPGGGPSDPMSGGLLEDKSKPGSSGRVTATEHTTVVPGDIVAIAINVKLHYYYAAKDFVEPSTGNFSLTPRTADWGVASYVLLLWFKEGQRAPEPGVVWARNYPDALLNKIAGGSIVAGVGIPGVGILNPNYPLERILPDGATERIRPDGVTAFPRDGHITYQDVDIAGTHDEWGHPNADGYHTIVYQFEVTGAHESLNDLVDRVAGRGWLDGGPDNVNPFNVPYTPPNINYEYAEFQSVAGLTYAQIQDLHQAEFGFAVPFGTRIPDTGGLQWSDFHDVSAFLAGAPYDPDPYNPNPALTQTYRRHGTADDNEGTFRVTQALLDRNSDGLLDYLPAIENPAPTIILHYMVRSSFYAQSETEFPHHFPPTYDTAKGAIHYPRVIEAYVAAMTEIDVPSGTQTGPFRVTLRFQEDYGDFQAAPAHDTSDEGLAALQAALVAGVEHGTVTGLSRLSVADASTRYQVTLEPELGFVGELTLQVPADTVVALNSNRGNLEATLTVPIDTSLQLVSGQKVEVVEPAGDAYQSGDEIEVRVPFATDGLTYEGDNPPYVTIYLGEQGAATARHATWQKGSEQSGSTIVPFVYVLQETDPSAETVSVDLTSLSIPRETTLMAASGLERAGTADPAVAPGEAAPIPDPSTAPMISITDASGERRETVTVDAPVTPVIYLPPTETDSKSVASDVPRSPVVFNELGNGSEAANDWLELRNVSGSDVSLKDWELSVVQDGKKEETSLIVFPDVSVPANGLLLITNMPADKTPLAGGENKGLSHASLVDAGLSLPDDGEFLLILRNAKEKLGLDEAFIDVAGGGGSDTDAFVRDETGDYDTYVWPLQVLEAPGDATEDALSSGKVWQRAKADIIGYHQAAWAEAAFTGIGYDRKVTRSAATAGTPGYPNGAAKTAASTPKGAVTISEIMFDSDRGKLPQWIELYNKSKTEALNLDRWQLEIQNRNSEDLIGRPIVTLTLKEKVIQPNQTLLIVAGNARASSADVFPADRVYNLFELHEKNLRIKTPRDTFLSGEGFYLKLSDRNGTKIDEVGNIDDNRRTDDAPVWVWPTNRREGPRSSVVRRYDKGTSDARDGMLKSNWALSANFNRFKVESLHYGHADDIGTPGYRKGGALPVELSSFKVTRTDEGPVVVTWTTESEVDNAGFNLRRSLTRDSGFTLLNPVLIAGAGTTGERQTYTFTDTSAKPGVEYYYQIEEVSLGGRPETLRTRRLPGPVSPANRALTTFGEVKQRE